MNDEQRLVFIQSQIACAMIEMEGMKAENAHRISCGNSLAYGEGEFGGIAQRFCIDHNSVVSYLRKDSQ